MGEYFYPESFSKVDKQKLPQPDSVLLKLAHEGGVKEDIYEASHNLVDYLRTEKIPNVMFLDKSARQSYLGLKEIWKKDYSNEPEPNIYFINPDPLSYEEDFPDLAEEFRKKYKNIKASEPILLYDNCIHSGNTISQLKNFFKYLGFDDVRVAITSVSSDFPQEKKVELDLICLPGRAHLGCNPFGMPAYIKETGSLISKPNNQQRVRELGRLEHKKIKEVFKD